MSTAARSTTTNQPINPPSFPSTHNKPNKPNTQLSKAYFAFFEVLFRNHIAAVLSLATPVFLQVVQALHEGLQSVDTLLSAQCASTIDYLATYFFQNKAKDRPPMRALRSHLQAQPDLIFTLLSTLFSQLLFGTVNHWAITRPILSLMLASEEVRLRLCVCVWRGGVGCMCTPDVP